MAHFRVSTEWLLQSLGAVLVFCQLATAQMVVVDDTFDVGAMTFDDDPDDPLDVAWSDGFVVDDTGLPGIGDGNALDAGGDVWADFDPVSLDALDQFVRLSFDFRFAGDVGSDGDASNGNYLFRVGLTDTPSDKSGYIIRIGTGGDGFTPGDPGNGIGLRQNDDRAGPYVDGIGVPTQDDTFSVSDNEPHSASLTVTMITGETTEDGFATGELDGVRLDGTVDDVSVSGDFLFGVADIIDLLELDHVYFDDRGPDFTIDNVKVEFGTAGPSTPVLQAGDADMDCDFDQLDLVKVQIAAKYLTGEVATWGEGDWDGAPGGSAIDKIPPLGNGQFDQLDIIAALAAGKYLQGTYCADDGFAAIAVPVPEPTTFMLSICAVLGLLGRVSRRRR